MQVVYGDSRSRFGEAVSVRYWDAEIVEELQGLWFGEGAANDDGTQFTTEILVDLLQEKAAQAKSWMTFRECFVDGHECVKDPTLSRGQLIEASLQSFLQIFEHKRDETHVRDF